VSDDSMMGGCTDCAWNSKHQKQIAELQARVKELEAKVEAGDICIRFGLEREERLREKLEKIANAPMISMAEGRRAKEIAKEAIGE